MTTGPALSRSVRAMLAGVVIVIATAPAATSAQAADDHDIALTDRDSAVVGDTRALILTITPRPGYTISRDGPLTIALTASPSEGLIVPRRRYQRRHAVRAQSAAPTFELVYRAARAGRYTLTVEIHLWLCGAQTCRPVRATRRVQIELTERPPST
ncbi:MAG: hypothetical protein AAGC55_10720 [Myxococcota bacterium]